MVTCTRLAPVRVQRSHGVRGMLSPVRQPTRQPGCRGATHLPCGRLFATGRGRAMTTMLAAALPIGMLLFAIGFSDLQSRLERWDYQRHFDD